MENTGANQVAAENADLKNGGELSLILKNQEDMKKEMEDLKSELKKARRSLLTSKIINVLTLLIILTLIGGGVFAGTKLYGMYTEYIEPVAESISALDLDELAEAVDGLDMDEAGSALDSWLNMDIGEVMDKLGEIVDAIDGLGKDIDALGGDR